MESKETLAMIIGDSLSMPRQWEGVEMEDAYIYKLEMFWREYHPMSYVIPIQRVGMPLNAMVAYFIGYFQYIGDRKVDVCIVNIGIADCAPRFLPNILRKGVERLPVVFRNRIIRFLHDNRPRLQRFYSFRITNPEDFIKLYDKLVKTASARSTRVYVINIAPGTEAIYKHSPGLKESIAKYNNYIRQITERYDNVRLVDVTEYEEYPEIYLTHDLHITKKGHDDIFQRISQMEIEARE